MTIARAVLSAALVAAALGGAAKLAAQPAGDATRGAALFGQCAACHSIEPGVHLTGPSLARVWSRRAGTVEGFTRYSEPLRHASIVWDAPTLDRWLWDPQAVVPGNLMTDPGLKDARQRADLVAYLKAAATGQAPPGARGGMMAATARARTSRRSAASLA